MKEPTTPPNPPDDLPELWREYARTRSLALRNELVLRHQRLAHGIAHSFVPQGGNSADDLVQIAYLGLIAAIERFDPHCGFSFAAYARATISGEIKHHLRDRTWLIRTPRRLRELGLKVRHLRADLETQLHRDPTLAEVASAAGVSEERLMEAMEMQFLYQPASLDAPAQEGEDGRYHRDLLSGVDPQFAAVEARLMIREALRYLGQRERAVVYYRFFHDSSQKEVARRLGVSQMHVSRLERRALQRLRELL